MKCEVSLNIACAFVNLEQFYPGSFEKQDKATFQDIVQMGERIVVRFVKQYFISVSFENVAREER